MKKLEQIIKYAVPVVVLGTSVYLTYKKLWEKYQMNQTKKYFERLREAGI